MRIHVISIGSELLIGHTTNTNLAEIGKALAHAGFSIQREVCIPDHPDVIRQTTRDELETADVVITIGGLGPTRDDMTRQMVAEALGLKLHYQERVFEYIRDYLGNCGVSLPSQALRTQAMVPAGATAIPNANGTAPGLWCTVGDRIVIMLPGPPREFTPMFNHDVLPKLQDRFEPPEARHYLHVCGIPESVVETQAEADLGTSFPDLDIAYCARPAMVDVRLTTHPRNRDQLLIAAARLRTLFGPAALDGDGGLVDSIGTLMRSRGWWLATAESCTGGGIGAAITDSPGASTFFAGSIVTYTNPWKHDWLGVQASTLTQPGAVSEACAREMAQGLTDRTGADVAIAVTGIAGPDGGTPDKPVGLVFIATLVDGDCRVVRRVFSGGRENIRERTVATALSLLRQHLLATVSPAPSDLQTPPVMGT